MLTHGAAALSVLPSRCRVYKPVPARHCISRREVFSGSRLFRREHYLFSASSDSPAASLPPSGVPVEVDTEFSKLENARTSQLRSTDLLARLLEASDPVGVARQHVEGLNEEFFMAGSAYMTLARKDGNADVANRIERALTAAWQVKESTLRPELQLLNALVRSETEQQRREIYTAGGSELLTTITMNDRWFFSMLTRMTADVERQPPNPGKSPLLRRLRAIAAETAALEKQLERRRRQGS